MFLLDIIWTGFHFCKSSISVRGNGPLRTSFFPCFSTFSHPEKRKAQDLFSPETFSIALFWFGEGEESQLKVFYTYMGLYLYLLSLQIENLMRFSGHEEGRMYNWNQSIWRETNGKLRCLKRRIVFLKNSSWNFSVFNQFGPYLDNWLGYHYR